MRTVSFREAAKKSLVCATVRGRFPEAQDDRCERNFTRANESRNGACKDSNLQRRSHLFTLCSLLGTLCVEPARFTRNYPGGAQSTTRSEAGIWRTVR
jgi:hypothetical protein